MELELTLRGGLSQPETRVLGPGEYVLGRDSACEVLVAAEAVSRRHARLTIGDAAFYIEDLGSANGTYLNDQRLAGRVALQSGQTVLIGSVEIKFRARSSTGEAGTDDTDLLEGRKYDIGDVVAVGGMGVVLQAQDLRIQRPVAMKVLPRNLPRSERGRQRFLREARVTGQLEHPNIVPVYDLGADAEGQPFYTMKYVRGITLKVILDDFAQGKPDTIAQYPLTRLLTIFQKTCDAIAFAHSKGVIHRDLKPENIMIGDFGEVLVLDWGLAKKLTGRSAEWDREPVRGAASETGQQTVDGSVMGTPHFMSPEQAAGRNAQLDERTDIFTLGGVLYNILTLHPPFPGATAQESLQRVRTGQITHPTSFNPKTGAARRRERAPADALPALAHCPGGKIPESLAAVAMKALAIDPAARYQTVRELQQDLEAFQGGFATRAEQAGTWKLLWLLVRRRRVEFGAGALAVAALLAVGGVAVARIIASEHRANATLTALRDAAPAYYSQAESLVDQYKFNEALGKIEYALSLAPDNVDFNLLKGNILESLLRLGEARETYEHASQRDPSNNLARLNIELCDKLLAANQGREELLPASLNELQVAMLHQQRSAEALAMVRRLGKDKQALYDTWKAILQNAKLLEKNSGARLIIDDQGLFYLNLSRQAVDSIASLKDMPLKEVQLAQTQVRDLTPLQGQPLTLLNLAGTPVSDLEPLRGMPLKTLILMGCRNVTDLSPLTDCRDLEFLVLPPDPHDVAVLRQLPNLKHIAAGFKPGPSKEAAGRALDRRPDLRDKALNALLEEAKPAAEFWREYDARQQGK